MEWSGTFSPSSYPINHLYKILYCRLSYVFLKLSSWKRNFNICTLNKTTGSILGLPNTEYCFSTSSYIKFLFHEDSLRKTYETLQYNLLYRWFIGYGINEDVPNHSTYSQNYKRKFVEHHANKIFKSANRKIEKLEDVFIK